MTARFWYTALAIAVSLAMAGHAAAQSATDPSSTPTKETSKTASPGEKISPAKPKYEKATFGAGCFWHVEAVFERLPGVQSAVSGYAGGNVPYPNYEMVHEGITGHAEVVQVVYDPEIISYEDLLKVFWRNHDPTTLNRQGEDFGTQYRSVIFYHNRDQREAALKSYRQLTQAGVFRDPIVTQLQPMGPFYRAEDEHQNFYGGKPAASTRRRKPTTAKVKKSQTKAKSASSTTNPSKPDAKQADDHTGP